MVTIALRPPTPEVYHPDDLTYHDTAPAEEDDLLFLDFYPGIMRVYKGEMHKQAYERWYHWIHNLEEYKRTCPMCNGMLPLLDYFPQKPNRYDQMVKELPYGLPDDCLNLIRSHVECRELYDHVMLDLLGLFDEGKFPQ